MRTKEELERLFLPILQSMQRGDEAQIAKTLADYVYQERVAVQSAIKKIISTVETKHKLEAASARHD